MREPQPTVERPLSDAARLAELDWHLQKLDSQIDLGDRDELRQFTGIFAEALFCAQNKRLHELAANTNWLAKNSLTCKIDADEQQQLLEVLRQNEGMTMDERIDFLFDHAMMRGIELGHADSIVGESAEKMDKRLVEMFENMQQRGIAVRASADLRSIAYDAQDYYLAGNGSVVTRTIAPRGKFDVDAERRLPPGQRAAIGPFRTVTISRDVATMHVPEATVDLTIRRRTSALLDLRSDQPRELYNGLLRGLMTLPSEALRSEEFKQVRKTYDDLTEKMFDTGHELIIPISTIVYASSSLKREQELHTSEATVSTSFEPSMVA